MTGRVVWFSVNEGFDFIHRDDKGSNIFVNITKATKSEFFRSLAQGALVQFDVLVSIIKMQM